MKKRITTWLMLASLIASIFAGCAKPEEPKTDNQPQDATQAPANPSGTEDKNETTKVPAIAQVVIGTSSAIEHAIREEYAYDMLASGVSELPLVSQDTTGNYHPLLASYATEDAQTWTYTIQNGMKWSDGTPVTAEDILFTLQYEDAKGSANLVDQTDADGRVTSAKYTAYQLSDDKRSISLTLASANVRELSNMTSFRVIPKHIYDGKNSVSDSEARIGCGPYMFESFNREAGTLSFVVNPYYPEVPNVSKIIYRLFSNEDTMYMALIAGDIDMTWNYSMGVSALYQDILAGQDTVTLQSVAAANAPAVLTFNNAKGPFADKNLRKAVSYALDYNAFKIYFGSVYAQIPNTGFVPTTTVGYKDTPQLATNLAKAKECLAAAGYKTKNSDGYYVDENGNVLSFALTVNAGKAMHVGYAELVKTNLEAVGIKVTLDAIDGTSYNAKTSNKFSENNITMEAAIFGYTAAGMGMMNGLASIYVDGTHAVQGGAQVYDSKFRSIIAEMSAAKTPEQYNTAAGKLQEFYAEETPVIALYWDNMLYAYGSKFDNVTIDYTFGLNNVNNWFSIKTK